MKKLVFPLVISIVFYLAAVGRGQTDKPAKATRTKVGQKAPAFEAATLDGQKFSLKRQRGKLVVVNFFATWCGPCLAEMPHLEKEIWQKFKERKFAMIALGREHSNQELAAFRDQQKLSFPIAGDPRREVFGQYAQAYIPRTVLIDAKGRIVEQIVGYDQARFDALVKTIEAELAKQK